MRAVPMLALVVGLSAMQAAAEHVKEYDHRANETDDGFYLLFCSLPVEEGSPAGDAFVVLGRGEDHASLAMDGAFGLSAEEERPRVGAIAGERVTFVRKQDDTRTFVVRIDHAQYHAARTLVTEWSKRESFVDPPDITALNFCEELVHTLDLKKPYRPVLSRANPHVYFNDLSVLNRERKSEQRRPGNDG